MLFDRYIVQLHHRLAGGMMFTVKKRGGGGGGELYLVCPCIHNIQSICFYWLNKSPQITFHLPKRGGAEGS